jgi:hypothetical protein
LAWHYRCLFRARNSVYQSWLIIPKRIDCRKTSIGTFKVVMRKAMEAKERKEVFEQVEKRIQKESEDFRQFTIHLKLVVE